MMTRKCSCCKITKPSDEFPWSPRCGATNRCRICYNALKRISMKHRNAQKKAANDDK